MLDVTFLIQTNLRMQFAFLALHFSLFSQEYWDVSRLMNILLLFIKMFQHVTALKRVCFQEQIYRQRVSISSCAIAA